MSSDRVDGGSRAGDDVPRSWSIDELAALLGIPTRTVREYRTLGLIHPPVKRGRSGVYDDSHRRRLQLIARLQERGYSLAAIRDLCAASASGRTLDDVLGAPATDGIDQSAVVLTIDELLIVVPAMADEVVLQAAIDAGLIHQSGDRLHARAPAMLALFGDVIAAGADPFAAIRMAAGVNEGARVQARAVADLVVDQLWADGRGDVDELVADGRRVRMQLTQAVASLVVHEVGAELRRRATAAGGTGLEEFVDRLRVGVVRSAGVGLVPPDRDEQS